MMGKKALNFGPDGIIKYHLVNFSNDFDTKWESILFVKDAFNEVNFALWPLQYQSTDKPDEAQVKIHFCTKDNRYDAPDAVFNDEVLAIAFFPTGQVYINDEHKYSLVKEKGKYHAVKVLAHEMGHSFGLGHSDDPEDLMYYTYNADALFTRDTFQGVNYLYWDQRQALISKLGVFERDPVAELAKNKGCAFLGM